MAKIPLLRVDNRLIHGQVTAFWIRSLACDRVILIDDTIPEDKFLRQILHMAMPPSTKLNIYNCEEAAETWQQNQFGAGKAIVVFKDIAGAQRTYQLGFHFPTLQIGGSEHKTGRKQVMGPIAISEEEAVMLNNLEREGVIVEFQILSENRPTPWKQVRKKAFPHLVP